MSDIKMRLGLEDKVSPAFQTLTNKAMANMKAFRDLEKQTNDLNAAWDELYDKGLKDSKMADDLITAIVANKEAMEEYANGTREASDANEEFSNSSEKTKKSATDLASTLQLVEKAWGLIEKAVDAAYQAMEKYNVQFNAEFTAAIKMHNMLGATNEEIQSMYDYAAALQQVGVVGDEAIISGMSELAIYADTTDQIRKLIPAVLNYTVAEKGLNTSMTDVISSSTSIGKALNGQARALRKQLGLTAEQATELDNMSDKTEKAARLVEYLNRVGNDANEILAQTASGGIMQTRNAMGDLGEVIGEKITPYIAELERAFYEIIQPAVEWIVNNMDTLIPVFLGVAAALGLIVAAIAIMNFGPIIALVGIIGLVIYGILQWAKAQDDLTISTRSSLGIITGMLTTFVAFLYDIVIVPIYNAIAMIANLVGNVFNDPIASVQLLFLDLGTTILNIANTIAGVLDSLFGTNAQSQINNWIGALNRTKDEIKAASTYEEVMPLLDNWDIREAARAGYEYGDAMSENISKAIDNNDFFKKFGEAIVPGADGTSALNTTSSDSLLKDEDIQLLLDVATRDFKLDYQQITPEVTITFGDVHETADVENIYEAIVGQLEEVFDSDLEVVGA